MKKSQLFILAAIAGFTAGAQAQIVVKSAPVQPYIIGSGNIVEKDGLGNCLRSSNYSTDLIKSVLTEKGVPVGVECGEIKEEPKAAAPVAAAPVAPVAPAAAAPAAQKVSLPADAVFAYDKADLTDQGKSGLAKFAADAKTLTQLEVVIAVGHADRIGSPAYNQKLSEKRAAAVKDFLVSQGIPANKVYTEGKGETQPVTGKTCEKLGAENGKNKKLVDCLAADRRVELEAVGSK
ncbi:MULTISPECIES: OmpA family protein [Uliginosibacterium]|jgi:OOP family OmpA-OmpF porin|uniref:OmpA family protein n=1 Tax=Uliginosibacterium aquaticum TaxID=2731212 RepID=A0ABX2IET0_9RHOO|nr:MULTISPECIES: OmpA family protein [Uliginosibacterium]MDO6386822.1 OmpA family protein [Uliginosibacterium sp. 31-12]NSL54652.1 OmpA family protein [Uliginosibacterium aquaticum]